MAKTPKKRTSSDPLQPSISGWLSKKDVESLGRGKRKDQKESRYESKEDLTTKVSKTKKHHRKNIDSMTMPKTGTKADSRKKLEMKPLNIGIKKIDSSKPTRKCNTTTTTENPNKAKRKGLTLARFNSASSDELPTFKGKAPRKKSQKQSETFKKYGVIVPSIDEIIADQKNLSDYKVQVAKAQALKVPSFKMPSSPRKAKVEDQHLLDCKHLTLEDINRHFKNNITFLSDIIEGNEFSDRHRRYYNKKSLLDSLTVRDLTYNTSTIVFSFEQLDHMIYLMQEQFDPEDKKTCYFFKVLVPELCLKIFMDTHKMSKREANMYLENRPV